MSDLGDMVSNIVGKLGSAGLQEVNTALEKLEENADEKWKGAFISLISDAVDEYGLYGIERAQKLCMDAINGKNVSLDFASLESRSDFLAVIQNMEADDKKKINDFFVKIGEILGIIVKAFLSGR